MRIFTSCISGSMKYEVRITKITPRGCCLVFSKEYDSDKEIEEMTVYNKKLSCFMTKELIENDIKNGSEGVNRKTRSKA